MEEQKNILTVNAGGVLTIKAKSSEEERSIIEAIKLLCSRRGLKGNRVSYRKIFA